MRSFLPTISLVIYHGTKSTLAFPSPPIYAPSLPDCSFRSPEPCQCPEHTIFQNSTTTMTIGANAKDVASILYNFFDVPWIGVEPVNTTGKDLAVGSTRTMPLADLFFVEEVLKSTLAPKGSFRLVVAQKNVPVILQNENGTFYFSGFWDECKTKYINKSQTDLIWHAHGCMTLPSGFDTFQRTAINNTMNYLRERNQLVGTSTEPLTKFFPPEFAGIPCC